MCVFSILNWLHSRKYKLPKSCGVHLHFQAVCKYDFFPLETSTLEWCYMMVRFPATCSMHGHVWALLVNGVPVIRDQKRLGE